ncbi:MAG: hypothetical protein ACLT0Y_05110 [Christensenellales bacterium]
MEAAGLAKGAAMTSKQGFYLMFYLLDQMYWEDTENDVLGGMLGAMNPDLFEEAFQQIRLIEISRR